MIFYVNGKWSLACWSFNGSFKIIISYLHAALNLCKNLAIYQQAFVYREETHGFCCRKSAEDSDMGERHWAIVCFLRWSTVCNASLVNVPTERAILFNHDKSSLSSLSWIQQSWVETISDKNFKINIKISQVHVSRPLKIEAGISSW